MSAYVRYVLERAGAAGAQRVFCVPHAEEWANIQVAEELQAVLPNAELLAAPPGEFRAEDLLVIPYLEDLVQAVDRCAPLCRAAGSVHGSWALAYGLRWRVLQLAPPRALLRHVAARRRVARLLYWIARLGLREAVVRGLRWTCAK